MDATSPITIFNQSKQKQTDDKTKVSIVVLFCWNRDICLESFLFHCLKIEPRSGFSQIIFATQGNQGKHILSPKVRIHLIDYFSDPTQVLRSTSCPTSIVFQL